MADRTAEIARELNNACMAIYGDTETQLGHKAAAKALNEPLQVTRLDIVRNLAKLSSAHNWTTKEIKGAIKLATKQSNAPKDDKAANSVKTLRSEMKLFCDPEIRDDVPDLLDWCLAAWVDEEFRQAAEEEGPFPVHKLFSRKYKLVLGIVRVAKSGEASFASAEDVAEYCADHDPDEDAEKVAKKLETLVDHLTDINDEFHNADIGAALDLLRELNAKDLLNSRAVAREKENRPIVIPMPVTSKPEPVVTEPVKAEPVVEGAFSLDETLGDDVQELLAAD